MAMDYWLKQTSNEPLFPDLLWSRPENKRHAGKLLIIGGSASGFSAPAEAYTSALKAGIGVVRVLLPASLEKTVGRIFPEAEFALANASGSFSREALAEIIAASEWADGILLAGDFGKNSETAILLESFVDKCSSPLTMTGDTLDFFSENPSKLLARPSTTLVPSFSQSQKLSASQGVAITSKLELLNLVEKLHELSSPISASIATIINGQAFVAVNGQVSTTKVNSMVADAELAARAAVWSLQNPTQAFAALTISAIGL